VSTLDVRRVEDRRTKNDFLSVPLSIYAGDTQWIAPLRFVEAERLNPKKHPFYDHGEAAFWVAYRDNRPVGRISAQIDQLHLDRYQDATGHFGMLEAIDDQSVFSALFAAAEEWLAAKGIRAVTGPFNLSINEESGLLVRGHEYPPVVMSDYSAPYYADRIEGAGYAKCQDLLAYRVDLQEPEAETWKKMSQARSRFQNLTIRPADKTQLKAEFHRAIDVFNDAWSDNWSYVPFTKHETDHLFESVKPFVNQYCLWFAEDKGEPFAILTVVPDLNQAAAGLNGRLLPFGWIPFLWRAKVKKIGTYRITLFGVRRAYQNKAVAAIAASAMISEIRKLSQQYKVDTIDMSWVLESNQRLRSIIGLFDLDQYKTFRVFEKSLEA